MVPNILSLSRGGWRKNRATRAARLTRAYARWKKRLDLGLGVCSMRTAFTATGASVHSIPRATVLGRRQYGQSSYPTGYDFSQFVHRISGPWTKIPTARFARPLNVR